MSTLDRPIWSRCSIALTCPARSHFQRTLSKERWARVGINVTAHQKKKKNDETNKGKREVGEKKRENKLPILKKLCAALLRSFKRQHSEK